MNGRPGPRGGLEYPQTRRVDHVDTYFGTKVPDPYRWLEDDIRSSKEVADWVAAENQRDLRLPGRRSPQREPIRRRLTELWNFAQYSCGLQGRRPVLLLQERRPAKPARALRDGHAGGRAAGRCWTPTPGPRTARSPWAASAPATTAATWPIAAPRPAPIGPPGTSWRSPPARCCPTSCAGPSSPRPRGPRTARASSTAATRSRRRAPSSRP